MNLDAEHKRSPACPFSVGDLVTVSIEKVVDGGWGLGRVEGQVIFVSSVCPGEQVEVRIKTPRKGYAEGELQSILRPSEHRVKPVCPVFGKCGGCQWQQMDAQAQLQGKMDVLQEDLQRIGKLKEPPVLPLLPAPHPWEYRTRIQIKVDRSGSEPVLGFYETGSHRIVPVEHCAIAAPVLNEALGVILSVLLQPSFRSLPVHEIHLHGASGTGEVQIVSLGSDERREIIERYFRHIQESLPKIVSQVYYGREEQRWVWGRDYLMERYRDLSFRISDRSFSQVNYDQNLRLMETVRDFSGLSGRESVLELYCGIGNFSLSLAKQAASLLGIDANRYAVADAVENAGRAGLSHCRFEAKPVAKAVAGLARERRRFDGLVIDPPREGIDRHTLRILLLLNVPKIVLVSCHPATLARDLKVLVEKGYRLVRIQPIDLFPQTFHLETVAELHLR